MLSPPASKQFDRVPSVVLALIAVAAFNQYLGGAMDLTDYLKILGLGGILAFILTWAWGFSLMLRDPSQGSDSENKKDPKKGEDKNR
ncbi:MAG: hypothetical protein L0387_39760 [Acidobacteria bacterium]|nr:hypothetical protein [Acidobacteriota bacterium]